MRCLGCPATSIYRRDLCRACYHTPAVREQHAPPLRHRSDNPDAADRLAAENFKLIWYVVRRWQGDTLNANSDPQFGNGYRDVIDQAWESLRAAARNYRPTQGTFATFAVRQLRLELASLPRRNQRRAAIEYRAAMDRTRSEGRKLKDHEFHTLRMDLDAGVRAGLRAVDANCRAVWTAWVEEEFNVYATARRCGVAIMTARKRLEIVKQAIRSHLTGYEVVSE